MIFFTPDSYAQSVEEYVPFEFQLETVFEFSTDLFVDPEYTPPDPASLALPSQNNVTAGQSLNNLFDMGYMIGLKKGSDIHFVSEYKVVVKFTCLTNRGKKYIVTQHLTAPLSDEETTEQLSEDILVCRSVLLDGEGNPDIGAVKIPTQTPVSIINPQVIYESNTLTEVDLSNTVRVYYWITDDSTSPINMNQRAGRYKTTIIFTMQEEL